MASTGFAVDDGSRIMQEMVQIHSSMEELTLKMPSPSHITSFYNIEATAARIKTHGFQRIALQFPDAMLSDANQVQNQLRDALAALNYTIERIFVLGDTSYGSCCVDEVAAQHLLADCVVHYGRACLSPTSSLPVIYVFGNAACDVSAIVSGLDGSIASFDLTTQHVLLYEPCYQHKAEEIFQALAARYPDRKFTCSVMRTMYDPRNKNDGDADTATSTFLGGMTISLAPSELFSPTSLLLYIGKESPHLTNVLLRAGETPCVSFNPHSNTVREESSSVNRTLKRRYFLVQKAKEAQIIGILMGTLGVASYLDVVKTLQELIAKSGRKAYTFVVGKINVPKLSNFAEIDAFCLVACAENTLLDSSEFFKPIVTPFELMLALTDDSSWTSQYKADFREVLPSMHQAVDEMEHDEYKRDEPFFSLVTGKYHQMHVQDDSDGDEIDASSSALVSREGNRQLATYKSEAADFLAQREYQGLDPRVGETAPHAAVQGSSGIARGYTHE
ncbi:unnamed protein product [Aphanomyces euteiches]|uniref:2-(3-amino-3-carboxypropyl)histidine synthase subunit 2 n=1 Tax=Aphanomyces euteiches TaxID=100861 RepID=A0A6G0XLT2_9STRA|nr:hypothetical protein Ae201684_003516 [Aphanomyces euteiches]KAH9098573.1 hypothetical protein Ae201684P_017785 [Aphanomyces euteiches]KAH9145351.1 hypothetical protein AeRB84_010704 [Aphanomyces euteiches]